MRNFVPGDFIKVNFANHFTACQKRGELLKQTVFAIKHTHSRWAEHFVSREGVKIHVELFDIDGHMRRRLGTIGNDNGTVLMCQ